MAPRWRTAAPGAVKKPSVSLSGSRTVVGYRRVSTDEQRVSGAGLEAQRQAIVAECARRGWRVEAIYEDGAASGKSLTGRPGLQAALDAVESRRASAIVVMRLDRLSRSMLDFAALMDRSRRRGWSIVALDLAVDTTTPSGEVMASVVSAFAAYERRLIGERTKAALAIKRQQGVRIGRPRSVTRQTLARIRALHRNGFSLRRIAARLDADGYATGHGAARWSGETVRWQLGIGRRK